MCFSPAPSIHRIYKAQSVGEVSVIPPVPLWAVCHVWMLYGLLVGSIFPLFFTYLLGEVFAIVFVAVYYSVTLDKKYVVKAAGAIGAFLLVLTLYAILGHLGVTNQSTHQTDKYVGFMGVGVSIILYASLFETTKQVVQTKSAASIPTVMCVVGTVSNSLWVVYGFVDYDLVVVAPNLVCVPLGVVQIALYFLYMPRRHRSSSLDSKFDTPTAASSPSDMLTPTQDINVAMGSPEDEYDIVISPMSSVI